MDDPDAEVDVDLSPLLIRYKSGRVRRLMGTPRVAAGADAATGVTSKDVAIDAAAGSGLTARLFVPSDALGTSTRLPLLVYFHGGGFALHSAFSAAYFRFVNTLVSAARVVAVSVEYRLAPEHPLPAAYGDAWAALSWAVESASCAAAGSGSGSRTEEPWLSAHGDATRLLVAGDSAGANMAHNVAMRAGRGSGGLPGGARIEGIALLHPYFRGRELVPSEDPRSPERKLAERWWSFVCAGRYGFDHPFLNPLEMPAAEWAALGCRRALVAVAELDSMSDRGRRYVEALRGGAWRGEEAVLYETPGEGHVFFLRKSDGRDMAKEDMIAAVASFMASSGAEASRLGRPSARSMGCDAKL
jgi:acetyl esterase/lipase